MKSALLATLTLAALATPPLAAQDEAAVRRQEAEAWVLRQAGADTFLDAEELARALAEIEVVIEVDRDEPAAEFRSSELLSRAWAGLKDAPEDAGRREVLRAAIEAYGAFLAERGRLEVALHILGGDPEQLTDTPADVALRAIYDDPRLVRARDRLRVQLGELAEAAPGTTGAADPVRAAVQRALENNDQPFVARLGTAALPALEHMIRETPDELQLRGIDPLGSLALIDPDRAIALIEEIDPRGGPVWRSRVLQALRTTDLLDTSGSGVVHPAAFEILARYMARAETREPAWELTSKVREHVLPAALRDILRESVTSEDPAARARGLSLLWVARGDEQVKALARELLASPHVDARRQAATIVADLHGEREPLPALARDPDPSIRAIAADALKGSRTHPEQEALELLLTDRDRFVRREALLAVAQPKRSVLAARQPLVLKVWSQPPGPEVVRALAADPEIRSSILGAFQEVPDAMILPFLEVALAGPSAAEVIAYARDVGTRVLLLRPEDTERYFAIVRRLVELEPELPRSDRTWNDAAASWKEDPAELRAFVDLACETENSYLLQKLLEDPNDGGVRQRGGALDPRLSALDPESWARIARAADRSDVADAEVARIVAEMPDGARGSVESIARDEASSPELRFAAAARLLRAADSDADELFLRGLRSEALLASLQEPRSNTIVPARPLASTVLQMWWKVDGARRNALIARFLADPLVPDETAAAFAAGFDPAAADGPALARALLDRWQPRARAEDAARKVVESVLWGMVHVPATRDDAVLRASLLTDGLQPRALEVVERLRDPAHLPALVEYLRGSDYIERHKQAMRVLASYQNEEAVQALVDAAASSREDEVAQYALEMLERIRQLHAARELWRKLASEKHSREGSVSELLALLEDENEAVRVQAVRGLATFGAIEAIPALIRRMKDGSPTLRAEVEAALEKLNRSEGE